MTWKFQMHHFFAGEGPLEFCGWIGNHCRGCVTPGSGSLWKEIPEGVIGHSYGVSPSQFYLICTCCDSPKEAGDALKSYFERDMLANKLLL